jgi:Threonine synthase
VSLPPRLLFGGLLRKVHQGIIHPSDVVVCTLTGNGLKDPEAVLKSVDRPVVLKNSLETVLQEAGLK